MYPHLAPSRAARRGYICTHVVPPPMPHDHAHGHAHFDCCGETFHGAGAYDRHRRDVHGERSFTCEACEERFGSPRERDQHARAAHR